MDRAEEEQLQEQKALVISYAAALEGGNISLAQDILKRAAQKGYSIISDSKS